MDLFGLYVHELHDVCYSEHFSTSWSHESVDSLEAAGAADTVASRASPRPGRVFDELVLSPFVSRQLLLVFSVQRLVVSRCAMLHTEAAVVALEAAIAADHITSSANLRSVYSVYIFLTNQILQLVGQPRR